MFSPQAVPAWREEHARAWRSFLQTEAGVTLRLRLQAMVCEVAIAGCCDSHSTTHSAGVGAGWNECVRKLIELAEPRRFADPLEAADETISGPASATAVEHEQRPEGEAELLARLSP